MLLQIDNLPTLFRQPKISPIYYDLVDKILELESKNALLSDADIRSKVEILRQNFYDDSKKSQNIVESFALTREVAFRKLGLKHFETQILGGLVLYD